MTRIGVFGDSHGNGVAFKAVLERMGPVDYVIGLGDYLFPSQGSFEIVEWMKRAKNARFVRGNHDTRRDMERHVDTWRTDPSGIMAFVDGLNEQADLVIEGHRILAVHDFPVDPDYVAGPDVPRPLAPAHYLNLFRRAYIERHVDLAGVDIFLWGGYHLPYVAAHPDVILINPGAAGLSADQELHSVSFMVLTLEKSSLMIEHHRLEVDVNEVIADVARQLIGPVPPERSWLVTRFLGESRVHTRDWKSHWGRITFERTSNGYVRAGEHKEFAAARGEEVEESNLHLDNESADGRRSG